MLSIILKERYNSILALEKKLDSDINKLRTYKEINSNKEDLLECLQFESFIVDLKIFLNDYRQNLNNYLIREDYSIEKYNQQFLKKDIEFYELLHSYCKFELFFD